MYKKREDIKSSQKLCGFVLISREVALRVPSAMQGLTSVFGMGTGVSLLLSSPDEPSAYTISLVKSSTD